MKIFKLLFFSILTTIVFSCSSDDSPNTPPEPQVTISDFEGSWIASSALFTNNLDSSESIEFIGVGGEIRYTMLPNNGATRIWVELGGNPVDEWDAQATLSGSNIIMTPVETSRPIQTHAYILGTNTITLTNSNASFDFTLSGATPVSATQVIVYVPNN